MSAPTPIMKPAGRVLSTLEEDGSRRWIYPRLSKGRFWKARRIVAYLLIALFTLIPFLSISGKPLMLLDVVHRRFTFFGVTFRPTDTVLLALLAVTTILGIFFATALLGRVWCGWACPQTVYLEFLYRPVERLFLGRTGVGGKHKPGVARWRHAAMYAVYLVLSLHLANTFLAYFVGPATLHTWILGSPLDHLAGFLIVTAVTGLMMFNFSFFREQTCLIACPYGRFQSALLDRQSLIISYDRNRGEPRGKMNHRMKDEGRRMKEKEGATLPLSSLILQPSSLPRGDCVDCGLCVAVCPTGIDIRDGLQFECVGCAQCIDVCDGVMEKVNRPRGLIRYGSQAGMSGEKTRLLRPRVIVYPGLMLVLGSILAFLLLTRSPAEVAVFRAPGQPFLTVPSGEVMNLVRVKVTNRTDDPRAFQIDVEGQQGIRAVIPEGATAELAAGQTREQTIEVFAPPALFAGTGSAAMTVRVSPVGDADHAVEKPFKLLGPAVLPGAASQPGTP